MTQEDCTERIRPTRRELRLARQAAESKQQAGSAKHIEDKGENSSADINDTVVLELHSQSILRDKKKTDARLKFDASCTRRRFTSLKNILCSGMSNGKHVITGVVVGFAVVAFAVGSFSVKNSSEAQAIAGTSVLSNEVKTSEESTPESVTASESGQRLSKAQKRAESANSIAQDSSAVCRGLAEGASSVVSAYVPDDFSMVYMPMMEGTYRISSPFGMRSHPITGEYSMHHGVDMAGAAGTPIYSVADGVVLSVTAAGANNGIVIEHKVNGKVFTSWYLHSYADQIMVTPGERVKAGQQITSRGSAGASTGAHLHFEMHHGAGMDTEASEPLSFLKDLGAVDISQKCAG